jgi:UDP-N-acetylmuramoylalanine--D-glutamate ligase
MNGSGEFAGRRVSVLGAARSGLAVAQLLVERGARVFVSDRAPAETLPEAAALLAREGIPAEFGVNSDRVLAADLLVVSPGVPSSAPPVREAIVRGIPVISELELAARLWGGPMIAITGTNGKTTTTTLVGRIFEDARVPSVVAGNIGTAFSQVVREGNGTAILEVSSFQLDHLERFHPRVSVILNVTPDHLDRYNHDASLYAAAKARIFARQGPGDVLIYNRDDAVTRDLVARAPAGVEKLSFGAIRGGDGAFIDNGRVMLQRAGTTAELIATDEITIRGMHNLANAMAAALAGWVSGIRPASIRSTLRNFRGVEHRLEPVRTVGGVHYVNDSKATNVDSVWYALQSFSSPIVLLLGGRDKGNDYAPLVELVRRGVRAIISIGESAPTVEAAFAGVVPVTRASTMAEAVQSAAACAQAGDVVLLSPACASFDWFENYEHRGRVFKDAVAALPGAEA